MTTYSLGKIGFNYRNTYASGTTYNDTDVVDHDGDVYICISDSTTGVTPGSDVNKWNIMASGASSIATQAGDIIYYNNGNLQRLPKGSSGQVLKVVNGLPAWQDFSEPSGHHVAQGGLPFKRNASYRKGFMVMTDGSMRVWGDNGGYMSGVGSHSADRSEPHIVAFPKDHPGCKPHQKYTGNTHLTGASWNTTDSCLDQCTFWWSHGWGVWSIDKNGKVWTWGYDQEGALGLGGEDSTTNYQATGFRTGAGHSNTNSDDYRMIPYCTSNSSRSSLNGKTAVALGPAGGQQNNESMWVLCSDGSVHTAGYNGYGQLGHGTTTNTEDISGDSKNEFVEIHSSVIQNCTKIVGGREEYSAFFALTTESVGNLYHCGYGGDYQFGSGGTSNNTQPTRIAYFYSNNINVIDVFTTYNDQWAIDSNKNMYGWGTNEHGVLGTGADADQGTPVKVLDGVVYGTANTYDYPLAYVILDDGSLRSCGNNDYGATGMGTTSGNTHSWVKPNGLEGIKFKKVCVGGSNSYNFVLALAEDGKMYSCGYNGNYQLGLGDSTARYEFQEINHQGNVTDIGLLGYDQYGACMCRDEDGRAFIWGYAGDAQLPEDDHESSAIPMPIIL